MSLLTGTPLQRMTLHIEEVAETWQVWPEPLLKCNKKSSEIAIVGGLFHVK